jgi:hypothetical protein
MDIYSMKVENSSSILTNPEFEALLETISDLLIVSLVLVKVLGEIFLKVMCHPQSLSNLIEFYDFFFV